VKNNRYCVVLLQNRKDTQYNDFIGKFYHFPRKYLNLLSHSDVEFVYYEPKKRGDGVYFGYGKISKVFPDRREDGCFFAEIVGYKPFSTPIGFHTKGGEAREKEATYNAQNAVRRVSPEVLDEICLDGGVLLSFKADAHLIQVLGEQLIANEKVGLLELVKNAYDANALKCKVRIEKIPGLKSLAPANYNHPELDGPVIVIEDDGDGMDRSTIELGWLRPASTLKTNVKEAIRKEKEKALRRGHLGLYKSFLSALKEEHGGRIPLGEKGVGRFATHRLGSKLVIKTKKTGDDFEYVLRIDWDDFETVDGKQPVDLDSIGVSLTRQSPSRKYGPRDSGTQLIIYGGREEYPLTAPIIKDLNLSLLKLRSPYHGPGNFHAELVVPQLEGELDSSPIYEKFPAVFTLDAMVDAEGKAEFELKFNPPKSVPMPPDVISEQSYDLRSSDHWTTKPSDKRRTPECGEFYLRIDFWYRAAPWVVGPDANSFFEYLDEFGGVSVYRDGLNIFPAEWGAVTDWLRLSKRHIKKGSNLSYYAMIGALELTQGQNINIADKTDRQGMLENIAFKDLSELVRSMIFYVENVYAGKRDQFVRLTKGLVREPRKLANVSKQSAQIFGKINEQYDFTKDPFDLVPNVANAEERKARMVNLEASLRTLQKSLSAMQDVQELLTEQAGFGLAIAVSVHEIAKLTSNFYVGVTQLLKTGDLDRPKLEELRDASAALKSELRRLAPLRAIRNEKATEFPVTRSIRFVLSVYAAQIKKAGIQLHFGPEDEFSVIARYGAVNQVINNLVENSCYWLRMVPRAERMLCIEVNASDREVLIADNGPDIDTSIRQYLFQPGYSLKVPPSGLGLYICKYYMQSIGGDIYEVPMKRRKRGLKGAQFILDFARVPHKKGADDGK